jgi:hypothetical protein
MSTLAIVDPKELRPLLHEQIDRLNDAGLEAVRRALLKLEAMEVLAGVRNEVDEAWRTGKITQEKIDESIREHRARQPYR